MKRFTTSDISDDARGASVAIGNFDGVHLGHQSVLDMARAHGAGTWGVLTFEPHPRAFFAGLAGKSPPPFRLMNADARAHRLEKLGADVVFELPFDAALSGLTAREFSQNILAGALGLRHVVVGADFCFGKGRLGTAQSLTEHGAEFGFDVTIAELQNHGSATISSTNIRKALSMGNTRRAAAMLGHWHRIEGSVLHGEKRGRTLGYPTANMALDGLHLPALGVYAVLVDVLTGPHAGAYHGVASLGVRPMFGENTPNLETFLFDFQGDLYDQTLSIGLVEYLRGEETFDNLPALITQMDTDSQQARNILAAL